MTYVQFKDETKQRIIAIFGSPQIAENWPQPFIQGEVEDDDPRVIWFLEHPFGDDQPE